jgi:hypothetical protein
LPPPLSYNNKGDGGSDDGGLFGASLRSTRLVSATWPESVRRLASTFLTEPVKITVGSDELSANKRIQQSESPEVIRSQGTDQVVTRRAEPIFARHPR